MNEGAFSKLNLLKENISVTQRNPEETSLVIINLEKYQEIWKVIKFLYLQEREVRSVLPSKN